MENETKEIRYIDLFGGVGGFRLGIERATSLRHLQSKDEEGQHSGNTKTKLHEGEQKWNGYNTKCVFYNDIDKYAVQTYNKNFGENYEARDIRTIKADSIPDFDMLCGGFPCQAFSIAGKRRGFEDTRGTLFFEIARIIKAKRPKVVFLENVKGLLNHNKGETFSIIIQTLSELGYDVQWMVLNSKFFGVPQNRERVFIIGSLRTNDRPEILPFKESSEVDEKMGKQAEIMKKKGSGREMARVYSSEGIAPTIRVPSGGWHQPNISYTIDANYYKGTTPKDYLKKKRRQLVKRINGSISRLTPTECERLQGFPGSWADGVSETQRYKQMGNAVTVNVVQAIATKLLFGFTRGNEKGEKE